MRRKNLALTLLLLVATIGSTLAAHAQSLTAADRDKALAYLESTKQGVIDATKGLSPAQFNFKSAPDRWSVAECLEHIAAAEDYLRGVTIDKVMKSGPRPAGEDVAAIDALVIAAVPDRSNKRQAPDPIKPTNRYGTPDASMKHFLESRAITEDYLKNTPDLREHVMMSPLEKNLDGYEWILLTAAHSARHTKQILEVKADPNFPKM
jgi:DinB superfamily